MATIHQTLTLLRQFHYNSLNRVEKRFVDLKIWGLDGMGAVDDHQVKDYLTDNECGWIRKMGKRFMITEKTKI